MRLFAGAAVALVCEARDAPASRPTDYGFARQPVAGRLDPSAVDALERRLTEQERCVAARLSGR